MEAIALKPSSAPTIPKALILEESFEKVKLEKATPALAINHGILVCGDNLEVMRTLLEQYSGKINLIYIDPPFCVGSSFFAELGVGDHDFRDSKSKLSVRAYDDIWSDGRAGLVEFMRPRLKLMRQLLAQSGSLYLHCDYRTSAHFRLLLEEIFGEENYINECIWSYKTGGNNSKIGFGRKHDTIHFVAKDARKATWNVIKEKSYISHRYGFKNITILNDIRGPYTEVKARDVWEIPALRGNQPERVDYPTQKPEALLERIILASSNPGDLVVDFFSGSGTSASVANRLGRNWIAVDSGTLAVHTARKRLLLGGARFSLGLIRGSDIGQAAQLGKIKVQSKLASNSQMQISLMSSKYTEQVDGWAIDLGWDCGSTFTPCWIDFRTRFDRQLKLSCPLLFDPTLGARIGIRLFQSDGKYITVRLD